MKYVFKQIDDISGSNAVTTVEFNADYIGDILEQFQMFIRGCGFYVDGTLDFVDDEKPDAWVADVGEKPTAEEKEWQGVAPSVAMQWTVNELMKPKSIYEDGYESPSGGLRA